MSRERLERALLMVVLAVLALSAIRPYDGFTWLLEVAPVLVAIPWLIWLRRGGFRFTSLLYCLIAAHAVVLIVGGHYSYARVPLFDWLKDTFHLSRNHYDRLGHFMQGFVPAMIAREILIRRGDMRRGRLLGTMMIASAMMISSIYEIIEWLTAVTSGSAATDFLGTQGDPWDTQEDMLMALIGSSMAVLWMSRLHDRFLARETEASAERTAA